GSANLVFVDEGHKGTSSEAKAWKRKQKRLGDDGLLVEYSATFAQSIAATSSKTTKRDLLHEYGKAIIFDYSYRHFYQDGYGKDFFVLNLASEQEHRPDDLLVGGLLLFYQQRLLLRSRAAAYAPYQLETPLWVFLGSSVSAEVGG